ncbi:MAG: hypothetical protein JWO19_2249 [Bryobacterales bacterium]|nr:hypothetical protein [Bryobacterales bacterium]
MHTEQQGQWAFLSPARILLRCCEWGLFVPALRLLVLATICLGLMAPAQAARKTTETPPSAAATSPEARLPADGIAEAMQVRAKPSAKDHTAVLMPLTGSWNYVESIWTTPKAEPQQGTGFVVNDMVLDGHYLSSKVTGTLNIGHEQIPFEGQELIGFDNAKKSLSFVAVDSLATGVTVGTGKYEEKAAAANKTGTGPGDAKAGGKERNIWESGRFTNPLTGVEQGFHSQLTLVDDEHYRRIISAVDNAGHETKLLEIDYTKK